MSVISDSHKSLQYDQITKKDYINNAGLTSEGAPSELEVFNLRSKGFSILQISFKLNCSVKTVNRRIKNIKYKIMIYEFKKMLLN